MSDHFLVKNCAPTLAGLKTGSMFSVEYTDRRALDQELRSLNAVLTARGLRAIPLRYSDRRALIYIYRPEQLSRDLSDPAAAAILRERGYQDGGVGQCVAQLVRHFRKCGEFPHEVGLFLGYPPHDVRGFMEDPHSGVQCTGFWKVYGDREAAERVFDRYRACTRRYCQAAARGIKLERLIVRTYRPAQSCT